MLLISAPPQFPQTVIYLFDYICILIECSVYITFVAFPEYNGLVGYRKHLEVIYIGVLVVDEEFSILAQFCVPIRPNIMQTES